MTGDPTVYARTPFQVSHGIRTDYKEKHCKKQHTGLSTCLLRGRHNVRSINYVYTLRGEHHLKCYLLNSGSVIYGVTYISGKCSLPSYGVPTIVCMY